MPLRKHARASSLRSCPYRETSQQMVHQMIGAIDRVIPQQHIRIILRKAEFHCFYSQFIILSCRLQPVHVCVGFCKKSYIVYCQRSFFQNSFTFLQGRFCFSRFICFSMLINQYSNFRILGIVMVEERMIYIFCYCDSGKNDAQPALRISPPDPKLISL